MSQSQLLLRESELKNNFNLSLEMVRVRENQNISYEIRITEYKIRLYPLKNILMSKSFDSIEGAISLFDKLNN